MVIDLDRCTRCDDCVRACAATHDNNPRFLRHGPSTGRVMIANACMHCADPVCMIGCPTGAIHRESFAGQVVINPVTCIGCTACANNCPYDAIRMVDIRDERGDVILGEDLKPIAKATKCDLCVENYGGPACERACPHGALERMNLNDLKPLARWMNR
jgi:Fe-S-cluster-containing dehydrogenase component